MENIEKLAVAQLDKNFLALCASESLLLTSKQPEKHESS